MSPLTLLIPSDWPQDRRECHWFLRDAAGRVVRQGCSEPAHWPGVGDQDRRTDSQPCHLLLAGPQTSCHRARLPPTVGNGSPELLAAAVEDRVLDDAAHLLFASGEPAEAGETWRAIGTVSRQRMTAIAGIVRELGLAPVSAWPLGLCLPPHTAVAAGGEMTWRQADGSFVSAVIDDSLPQWLPAAAEDTPPLRCTVLDQPVADGVIGLLAHRHVLITVGRDDYSPRMPAGPGFLQGELAPAGAGDVLRRHAGPAASVAAAMALATLAVAVTQWAWLAFKADSHRQEIASLFRQSFPGAAMVDPLLQMQRQVAQARRNAGRLAGNDFLRLAEPLAEVPAGSLQIREMVYEDGRLRVTASLSDEGAQRLKAICREYGIDLAIAPSTAPDGQHPTSFTLGEGVLR